MRVNWGGVLVGAFAGLGLSAIAATALFVAGLQPSELASSVVFIFIQLGGQLVAGYVGGRFGHPLEAFHGSQAALMLYLVASSFALAAGSDPSVFSLVFGAVVALVLGAAGGVLAGE
ncbi:MAG: hypothetical protein ACE5E8_00190 [Acidimicrobiia bacterium]